MDWEIFFTPYVQTVSELKVKLRGLRDQYEKNGEDSPIEFVTGRVKSQASIEEKIVRRHLDENRLSLDLQDIAGVRIMTKYVEDIYTVVDLLRQRTDFQILEERDYVTNAKPSGYRSYHIVIEYPVQMYSGELKVLAEIQVRTMAMNFWATVEHDLRYKHGELSDNLADRLTKLSESTFALDQELSEIRAVE
ncbi:GTP pyrophosphokinase family protein [Leuconostoc falkenbergense]|jgi:putative GTP pyrophosphokinase|uniref:GTP pyrophosphokinase family protein n=2 Tax=Leuconostoc TaxID=1243 RepID=A0A9X3EHU6_9LACO|nr:MULTISPECIES: GTP pyrophosphokinase family protein [Leuconostoc]KDA48290.1 GTP pyrophosphokinase [Leuconostoc pseudomesenteroides 1159]KDA50705.1 GTP pyrophosphokinase [Leuconostoc pseudomesenteroides PS12]CCJ67594.1 GTP pyrophosphokinase [Leuconostoc pseudomesenteroides 4882]MBS0957056.1 GTP pyrophosphokinase family protein [Leuconostoc pseudomesenteroides]MCT4379385.1 GTP pyrophosphokinase family protein [Leuconostoc falkenbergense]